MDIIKKIERENMRMDMPVFRSGDTVKVHLRIVEGEKERIQVFQGNVIRIQRGTTDATFTVRKISDGVGVERIFPPALPLHRPCGSGEPGPRASQPSVLPARPQGQSRSHQAPRPLLIRSPAECPWRPEGPVNMPGQNTNGMNLTLPCAG